jgi:hypothetical protein
VSTQIGRLSSGIAMGHREGRKCLEANEISVKRRVSLSRVHAPYYVLYLISLVDINIL